jgi:hypothetical protein
MPLYPPSNVVGSGSPDATDVGDDVVAILGQSNAVGIGENLDATYLDVTDPRVFQLGDLAGSYFQKRALASDPLMHQQQQPAPACVGFGMTFAREYVKTLPANRNVLLVPTARGSTSFNDPNYSWDPAATPAVLNLYTSAVAQIQAALALNPKNRLVAVLWHQGEGDTGVGGMSEAVYAALLDSVIDSLRTTFANPTLPFLVGPMVPERVEGNINAGYPLVNAAHYNTPRRKVCTWWFPGPRNAYNSVANGGTIHYAAAGQRILGQGYAAGLAFAKANVLGTAAVAPTGLTLTQSGTTVTAAWTPGKGRSTDFKVEYSTNGGSTWTTATRTASLLASQPVTGLTLGATVQVRVSGINEQGTSSPTSVVSLTLATIPGQVTGLTAGTSGSNRQDLTWTAVAGATSYLVEYKRHADSTWAPFATTPTTNAASVTGLLTGTSYDYRVTAVNPAGSGTVSSTLQVSTTTLPALATGVGVDMAVGFSTARKLRTAFAGSAIRVRRSSDSAEADIGFDANGNLDEAALLTHVGAGDGFVKTIYNQGTQATSDLTQTTTTLQPKIVTAGVVEKILGVPMVSFTGTQWLGAAFQSLYAAAGATVLTVAQKPASAAAMYVYAEDNAGSAGGTYSPLAYTSGGQPLFNDGSAAKTGSGITDDGTLSQFTSLDTGTALSIAVDGTIRVTATGLTPPVVTISATTFGARRSGGANAFFTGHVAEVVGWTAALTTQQQTDGAANQKSFYGTP